MARKTIKVQCEVCGKKFDKETRRIKQSRKEGKPDTCSRSCASRLTNDARVAPPSSKYAENTRRSKALHPEEDQARKLVRQAIKAGRITVPDECEECYKMGRVEAHHEDHSRPYLLYWLCKKCHAFHDKYKLTGYGTDYSDQVKP